MKKRLYVLSMTDMGSEQQEFATEQERTEFLYKQDATFDDFYTLDVEPDGSIEFCIASTED